MRPLRTKVCHVCAQELRPHAVFAARDSHGELVRMHLYVCACGTWRRVGEEWKSPCGMR